MHNFRNHIEKLCGNGSYSCSFCGLKFKQKSLMNKHISKNHNANRFECFTCNRTYVYKRDLDRHLRKECGVEPSIVCPYCPYKTRYKHSLKKHILLKHFEMSGLTLASPF